VLNVSGVDLMEAGDIAKWLSHLPSMYEALHCFTEMTMANTFLLSALCCLPGVTNILIFRDPGGYFSLVLWN
jgi:hypothetical protein